MRESLIETRPPLYTDMTEEATVALPSSLVTATAAIFGAGAGQIPIGAHFVYIDDAGNLQFHTVAGVGGGGTTATTSVPCRTVASGGAGNMIYRVTMYSPFFIPDATPESKMIQSDAALNPVLGVSVVSGTFRYKISQNEGVYIKSIYFRLPHTFCFGPSDITLKLRQYRLSDTTLVDVTQFGEDLYSHAVIENTEIPVRIYVPPFAAAITAAERWVMVMDINNTDTSVIPGNQVVKKAFGLVSNNYCPTALQYHYVPIILGMRVVHATADFIV